MHTWPMIDVFLLDDSCETVDSEIHSMDCDIASCIPGVLVNRILV